VGCPRQRLAADCAFGPSPELRPHISLQLQLAYSPEKSGLGPTPQGQMALEFVTH